MTYATFDTTFDPLQVAKSLYKNSRISIQLATSTQVYLQKHISINF
jgi:hypothetical protein